MRFLVLGPLEVFEEGGDPLPIAGSKERTILACLISRAGRAVSNEDLIENLLGEQPPRTAEKTLSSYVSRLRRDLSPARPDSSSEIIVFRGHGYALIGDGHEVDAATFEQLAQEGHELLAAGQTKGASQLLVRALGLWRGDAYQGCRYTTFAAAEGERLDEVRRTTAENLIESSRTPSVPIMMLASRSPWRLTCD